MTWGGFVYVSITDEHHKILESKKNEIQQFLEQKKIQSLPEDYRLIDVQQQVVNGLNLVFKLQISKNSSKYIEVSMFKSVNNDLTIYAIGATL